MRAILTAVLLVVLANAAAAKDKFTVGDWYGGSYYKNGRLSHCAMSATYRSGIMVLFGITRSWKFILALHNREWSLVKGAKYPLRISVDYKQATRLQAVAYSTTAVRIKIPSPRGMFAMLKWGNRLQIDTAGKSFGFKLTGTAVGLERVRTCVRNELALERGQSNPFVQKKSNPFDAGKPRQQAATDRRVRAITIVANILNRAGLSNFRVEPPNSKLSKTLPSYEVVWKGANVIGGFRIISPRSGYTLDGISIKLIASDGASCKGKFGSGVKRDGPPSNTKSLRFFTFCRSANNWYALYTLFPRKNGEIYLFMHFTYRDQSSAKFADDKILAVLPAFTNN